MKCSKIIRILNAYLDGELPEADSARVRQHLQRCPACAGRLEELRRLNSTLDALPQAEVSPFFAARVRARAAGRLAPPVRPAPGRPGVFGWLRSFSPVPAMAAVFLVATGILLGGSMAARVTAAASAERNGFAFALEADTLDVVPAGSLTEAFLELTGEQQ